MAETIPTKQPCPGSCHCGLIKFIIYLHLPHIPRQTEQEIYRCNCTTCHKMAMFHVHPANPATDFVLLSPLDPDRELSTYRCCGRKRKFFFCPVCGVRCFTFSGESERGVVDLGGSGTGGEGKTEVWRAKWDGNEEDGSRPYLSVNATSIDFREDFDLRVLTEEKRVMYLDDRGEEQREKGEARWDRPHWGGSY